MQLVNDSVPQWFLTDVQALVSPLYILSGLGKIGELGPGLFYAQNDRPIAFPINTVSHSAGSGAVMTADGITSDEPVIIGNWLSEAVNCILPADATHDPYTDLLYTLYLSMKNRDYAMSFVSLQCFLLMSRISTERLPMINTNQPSPEIRPYEL